QDKQFQKYRRLVPHHLLYRLAAAATEGKMHLADGIGVQRLTRPTGVSPRVSRIPRREPAVDAAIDDFGDGVGVGLSVHCVCLLLRGGLPVPGQRFGENTVFILCWVAAAFSPPPRGHTP